MSDFICYISANLINTLSEDGLAVYPFIQAMCSCKYAEDIPVSLDALLYLMYGKECSRKSKDRIKQSIADLISDGIIEGDIISSNLFLIKAHSLECSGQFTTIVLKDLQAILRSELNKKHTYIHYYMLLMLSRNGLIKEGRVGTQPILYFSNILNTSIRTLIRYNKELESLKVIYIRQSLKRKVAADGTFYREPNTYGRYDDKDYINAYADEKDGKYIKGKLKNRDNLTSEEKLEVAEYIRRHNQLELSYQEKNPTYIPNLLD